LFALKADAAASHTAKARGNGHFSKICKPFDFPLGFDPNQMGAEGMAARNCGAASDHPKTSMEWALLSRSIRYGVHLINWEIKWRRGW
jgi:hypothetical protein